MTLGQLDNVLEFAIVQCYNGNKPTTPLMRSCQSLCRSAGQLYLKGKLSKECDQ